MFLSFFIPVAVFLLMAARRPSEHRSMIALEAWWYISHGVVMAIQTVEARIHGAHRDLTDVVVTIVIGSVLLALLPAKREAVAMLQRIIYSRRHAASLTSKNAFRSSIHLAQVQLRPPPTPDRVQHLRWETSRSAVRKKRNNRRQFRVLKDVRTDKKEHSRGNNCETAIKYIDETETMPKDESRGATHKQNTPEESDDPRSPRNFCGGRFV